MATINTGYEVVMVIHMRRSKTDGTWIESVTRESRSVYENSKGRFIKTVNYGQIPVDDDNIAVIVGWGKRQPARPSNLEIEQALHGLFKEFSLEGFIK